MKTLIALVVAAFLAFWFFNQKAVPLKIDAPVAQTQAQTNDPIQALTALAKVFPPLFHTKEGALIGIRNVGFDVKKQTRSSIRFLA